MNTNVGDMPIEIFGDYISDCLGEEWSWEYFIPMLNWYGYGYGDRINFGIEGGAGDGCIENTGCDDINEGNEGNGYWMANFDGIALGDGNETGDLAVGYGNDIDFLGNG